MTSVMTPHVTEVGISRFFRNFWFGRLKVWRKKCLYYILRAPVLIYAALVIKTLSLYHQKKCLEKIYTKIFYIPVINFRWQTIVFTLFWDKSITEIGIFNIFYTRLKKPQKRLNNKPQRKLWEFDSITLFNLLIIRPLELCPYNKNTCNTSRTAGMQIICRYKNERENLNFWLVRLIEYFRGFYCPFIT